MREGEEEDEVGQKKGDAVVILENIKTKMFKPKGDDVIIEPRGRYKKG